ncbi:hypothetical protein KKB18_07260, partial [bacterium]|nr:hypothetical protein [bacterium]
KFKDKKRYREIKEHKEVDIGDLHITPIPMEHIIPSYGYIIRDKSDSILYSGDTCDASGIFEIANTIRNLKAIVIEVTFSSDYQEIADESKHLTPTSLVKQLEKLRSKPKLYLYHMKSNHASKIAKECEKMNRDLELLQQGKTYHFGS